MKLFSLFLIILNLSYSTITTKDTWCWTRAMNKDLGFVLNPSQGGYNWGYCQSKPIVTSTQYTVTVGTSQITKSETTSTVYIQMFGTNGQTKELILSNNGFEIGSEQAVDLKADDIGKVSKIILKLVGNHGYRCRYINVQANGFTSSFQCLKRISPCKAGGDPNDCIAHLYADGDNPYKVVVKTIEGTNAPLFILIKGNKGDSRQKLLSELGFETGSINEVNLNIKDVGEITGLQLQIGGNGKWKPGYITITNTITKDSKEFVFGDEAAIISPGKDTFQIDQNSSNNPSQNPNDEGSANDQNGANNKNTNDSNGGLLSSLEKKNILKLSCDQIMINPSIDNILFGPDYPTKNVNYMRILAQCPSDCHKFTGVVYGLGIHPENSPICLSAIIDKAMSFYGGIISISIFPGRENYQIPSGIKTKYGDISLNSFQSTEIKKSYVLSKVDNIDLVEKDIRILDHNGALNNEGRLEFRINGIWGTICSLGNDVQSAMLICKSLNYKGGVWKNPNNQEGKNFCLSFNGFDYCGAKQSRIHFSKLECTPNDSHINKCNKDLANYMACSHEYDAIISCYNDDFVIDPPIKAGVISLKSLTQGEGDEYTGRLEMFYQNKFSPICNLGFNEESERVACKQMGYNDRAPTTLGRENYTLKESEIGFSANNVSCKGNELELLKCNISLKNINCKHDQDVVLTCKGGQGDPSGKTQYKPKIITNPPELGKLGLVYTPIDCTVKGNNKMLIGDPGSLYILQCPAFCSKYPGIIVGTGIYTSDSNICMAAIHAGVIDDSKGGKFGFIKSFSQTSYIQTIRNDIFSNAFSKKMNSTFSVSEMNSSWTNMAEIFNAALRTDNVNNRNRISTFLEISDSQLASIPKPIFSYIETNPLNIFAKGNGKMIEAESKTSLLKKFSIVAKFKMIKFLEANQYVFSYSTCVGLAIDKEDNLLLGDLCNRKNAINTNVKIPLNEIITVFISKDETNLTINISSILLGNKVMTFDKKINIQLNKLFGIGKDFDNESYNFNGEINFVNLYDSTLDISMLPTIVASSFTANKKQKISSLTLDGRECLSPCLDSQPGDGNAPKDSQLTEDENFPSQGGNETHDLPSQDPVSDDQDIIPGIKPGLPGSKYKPNFGTNDKKQENNIESIEIGCDITLEDKRFAGSAGKIFRVHCSCDITKSNLKIPIYGLDIYHPKSSICLAGYHTGVVDDKTKEIIVEITGGLKRYPGGPGKKNFPSIDITEFSNRSYIIRKAQPLKSITCETSAKQSPFQTAALFTKFVVSCPQDCSKVKNINIYGSDIYSEESSICLAAIHCGSLSDKGGEVEFMIYGPQVNFKSTKGFGITSKERESNVRSFKFFGVKSSVSFNFVEDYQGSITDKWKMIKPFGSEKPEKESWEYKYDTKLKNGIADNFMAIFHTGSSHIKKENAFGSLLVLQNAEWANGIIRFNFQLGGQEPIGFLFRYTDENNYYGVVIDVKNRGSNIKLISKINSAITLIESRSISALKNDIWVRCILIQEFSKITLMMQFDKISENKLIFCKDLSELHRGTIAFASNGNPNFYINGITIEEYKENQSIKLFNSIKSSLSFEAFIKKIDVKTIKKDCAAKFEKGTPDYFRCLEPHTYCMISCDEKVNFKIENVGNYKCYKQCMNAIIGQVKAKKGPKQTVWIPSEGLHIDFKPDGSSNYLPAYISKAVKDGEKWKLTVEYIEEENSEATRFTVSYPSPQIKMCGSELRQRKDCEKKI